MGFAERFFFGRPSNIEVPGAPQGGGDTRRRREIGRRSSLLPISRSFRFPFVSRATTALMVLTMIYPMQVGLIAKEKNVYVRANPDIAITLSPLRNPPPPAALSKPQLEAPSPLLSHPDWHSPSPQRTPPPSPSMRRRREPHLRPSLPLSDDLIRQGDQPFVVLKPKQSPFLDLEAERVAPA